MLELPFGSLAFLHDVEGALKWERNPIYATLHESSYADGVATRWSAAAARCRTRSRRRAPSPRSTSSRGCGRTTPGCTAIATRRPSSPSTRGRRLYDADRLRRNEVPVAATIYVNDVYVERAFAVETAALVGNLRAWETNEYEHNGLRADGERVVGRLIDMVKGRA